MKKILFPLLVIVGLPVLALSLGGYNGGLLTQFVALGLATAALALVWGFAGILTLGHAVSFAIGAYCYAWFGINVPEYGHLLGMIAGMATAAALSALIGFIGLRGKVDDVAFGLFTLVVLFAAGQLAIAWPALTGGFNGLSGIRRFGIGELELDAETSRVALTLAACIIVAVLHVVVRGPFGGVLQLLRDSPIRASSFGYNVPAIRIAVFTAAGAIAAFAGALYVGQVRFVSPTVVGMSMAVGFVVWALIGSRTSIYGAFGAAILMGFVTNLLSDKLLNVWMLITGILFILFVVFAPQGVVELVRAWLPKRFRRHQEVVLDRADSAAGADVAEPFHVGSVSVMFGKFQAVTDAQVTAQPGQIHCLIGPNGAGKSTLLNAVSGIIPNAQGRWEHAGAELSGMPPWKIARRGIGRKFQKPQLALDLSVAQNLAMSAWGPTQSASSLMFHRWRADISDESFALAEETGLAALLEASARELSHGQRQALELAMVLASGPRVLLLDEPAAGMTKTESHQFGSLLLSIARQRNIPILMVEHDMELIRRIADRVTVLAAGVVVASGTMAEIEGDPRVRELYLGARVEDAA